MDPIKYEQSRAMMNDVSEIKTGISEIKEMLEKLVSPIVEEVEAVKVAKKGSK